jgi:2'-5' RNA ligase
MFAIMPPADLTAEIDKLRHEFSENFKCYKALKPPIHITLFPPFKADASIEKTVTQLQRWGKIQHSFIVELKDFNYFENKKAPVLYIDVIKSAELKALNTAFKKELNALLPLTREHNMDTFHPHITLGYRDVTPEMMPDIKRAYSQRKFRQEFTLDAICFWKHDTKNWQTIQEIKLTATTHDTTQQSLF